MRPCCYQLLLTVCEVPQTTLNQMICWKDSQNSPWAVVYIKGAGEDSPGNWHVDRPGEPAQGTGTDRPRELAHGQAQGTGPGNWNSDRSGNRPRERYTDRPREPAQGTGRGTGTRTGQGCTCRALRPPWSRARWHHTVGEAHLSSRGPGPLLRRHHHRPDGSSSPASGEGLTAPDPDKNTP